MASYKFVWPDTEYSRVIEIHLAPGVPLLIIYRTSGLYLEVYRTHAPAGAFTSQGPMVGPASSVSSTSGGEQCRDLARTWLSECLTNHAICAAEVEAVLPTRVLALDRHNETLSVRLVDGLHHRGQYVALSYCWGDAGESRIFKTTRDTLATHQDSIPLESLPPTIKQAVEITAQLGFIYVWVDALCIVQDDEEDWAREAAMMCDVYSGSTLTLVASGSKGSAEGLFREHTFSRARSLVYKGETVFVRPQLAREHDQFDEILTFPFSFQPINFRAWTLQEVMLSPRALLFAEQELKWVCNETRKCECGASRTLPTANSAERSDNDLARPIRLIDVFREFTLPDAYEIWERVLCGFSTRLLSFEQDRLTALSGLAHRFADLMKAVHGRDEVYLAGLWAGALPKALVWTAEDYSDGAMPGSERFYCRRPTQWRAPTWSWAGLEGPVLYRSWNTEVFEVEVVSYTTTTSSADPFGQVTSCAVVLKGRLLHGLVALPRDMTPKKFHFGEDQKWRNDGRFRLVQQGTEICGFKPDLEEDVVGVTELKLLKLGFHHDNDDHSFMVLKQAVNRADAYQRVGIALLQSKEVARMATAGQMSDDSIKEFVTLV